MFPDAHISSHTDPRLVRQRRRGQPRRLTWIGSWCFLLFMLVGMLRNPSTTLAAGRTGRPRPLGTPHIMRKPSHQPVTGSPTTRVSNADAPCDPSRCGTPPLLPKNRHVQDHPKVYLLFWGSKWNTTSDGYLVQSAASNFFAYLPYGQYQNILLQYGVAGDYNTIYGGSLVDTANAIPSTIHEADLVNEAARYLDSYGIVNNYNTQVMIFPQQGSAYDSTFGGQCGHHNYGLDFSGHFLVYSVILYSKDVGCSWGAYNTDTDNMTKVVSHEYAEAATDPLLDTWRTVDNQEIGDLCNESTTSNVSGFYYQPADWSGPGIFIQEEWSNEDNACVMAHGKEYWSSVNPHKRTVQNDILRKYQSMGENNSVLSYPLSQETALGNGAVSYFSGPSCSASGSYGSCAAIYWSSSTGSQAIWGDDYSKYLSEGGPGGNFGWPTSDPVYANGGAVSFFQGAPFGCPAGQVSCAAIYSSSTGNFAIWGGVMNKYLSMDKTGYGTGSNFGWPTSDPVYVNGGAVSFFQGAPFGCPAGQVSCAAIYSSSTGNFAIWGGIMNKYLSMDKTGYGTGSNLGWLKSDPIYQNGGAISYTQNGGIYDSSLGTYAIWGNNGNKYWSIGGPGSNLGWLKSDPIYRNGGAISYTQNGGVYDKSGVGTFAEWGNVGNKYWNMGEEASILGWPKIDTFNWGGGSISYFQGGAIYSSGAGTFADWGNDDIKYENLGGPDGKLGWPVSDPTYLSGGAVSYFQGGNCGNPGPNGSNSAIYDSPAGTYEVNGCIYATYLSYNGPSGILGYPISDEWTNSSGYPESDFTGGSIVWVNGQAQVYTNTGCGFAMASASPAMSSVFPAGALQPNC